MKLLSRLLALLFIFMPLAYGAQTGTIVGIVKDPGGVPFRGAFVRAKNAKTKTTVSVLSDPEGRYHIENLPLGEYNVQATAVGYKSDLRSDVKVDAARPAALDFALQKGMVRWSDLSVNQARKLLPEGTGRTEFLGTCMACHGFQSRIASSRRDEEGWVADVAFMREAMHFLLSGLSDQSATNIVSYLNSTFGMDSTLPRSPAELQGYGGTVRPFSDDAMKIVYVDYDLPGPNRMPWSASPDKEGNIWIPYYGRANKIGRLNPETGEVKEFAVPNQGTAGIHSAMPAPDGTVWLTEQAANKIGKWDPHTQAITEYQDAYVPGKDPAKDGTAAGSKHTLRVDSKGYIWATASVPGTFLTRLDPKTGKFTNISDVSGAYGLSLDRAGNVWFAQNRENGKIGKVDAETLKVTSWLPPTGASAHPRRIEVAPDGIVWFAEYAAGKIGRFDPKTATFKEFQLPGPEPSPYALGIDKENNIWYSSEWMDVIGRLDPKTGQVTEYPFPYPENTMREFFIDSQGRMWFGTPANNKVGYFYLAQKTVDRASQ